MTITQDPAPAARFVGQRVKRREDPRLLTGHGRYADDVSLPGQLHIAFVRSDAAAGRIVSIDTTEAKALPGVQAVFTGADLNAISGPLWTTTAGPQEVGPVLHALAQDDVRFVGDPIAMVVASSRYVAEDACELIEVYIDATTAVSTLEQAMAPGAPLVHPRGRDQRDRGAPPPPIPELDAILAGGRPCRHADLRHDPHHQRADGRPQPGGLVGPVRPGAAGLAVDAEPARDQSVLGARPSGFRKTGCASSSATSAAASARRCTRRVRRRPCCWRPSWSVAPVKWIEDRRENLISANQARHDIATLTMATDADGHFLAATFDLLEGVGSFPAGGGTGSGGMLVQMMFTGPYRIPKIGFASKTVFTNTCGKAPFRGPWAVEAIAREQMIDAVAHELGLDPLELRRRNVIHQSELPYSLPSGIAYDIVTPEETLEQAAEMADWGALRAEQAEARTEGRFLGIGLSICIEPSAVAFGAWATEQAVVRMDTSGQVEVLMGTGSHGHSLETTIPQIVADHLGCALDDVVLRQGGDSPYGPGTGGSRSAVIAGGAAQAAATILRAKVVELAAHLLEASPEDLEVADSVVSVRGTPVKAIGFAELAGTAYLNSAALPPGFEPGLEASNRFSPPTPFTWSNACHLCVCEIDPETGAVTLLRYLVSEDCGVMINPMVVEGQIAGGVVQGIGGALYEEMAYDDLGNPLATTFLDYLIPTRLRGPRPRVRPHRDAVRQPRRLQRNG